MSRSTNYTAVDYVTFAVFAALYRALWYAWSALGALFPFNQVLNSLFFVMSGVMVLVIVRKKWAATLYVVATQLINLFLQGELLIAAILFLTWGLLADLYVNARISAGSDPFTSAKEMFVAGILLAVVWVVTVVDISFPVMFAIELPLNTYILASLATFATGAIGGWLGYGLGSSIKKVIG